MIFYFTGTGNSFYVAKSMGDDKLINIKDALGQDMYWYGVDKGESVGIVCPVYYGGIPKPVLEFVRRIKLTGTLGYVYCILTNGGGPYAAGKMLETELKKKGYPLHAIFDVKMPSNYVMFGSLWTKKKDRNWIDKAKPVIKELKLSVESKAGIIPEWSAYERLMSKLMSPMCEKYMPVKKFYIDKTCTGCGVCAKKCPMQVIKMECGRPTWTKDECVRCMACLSCKSVQYGSLTRFGRRYTFTDEA